jgi:hypothetical protein
MSKSILIDGDQAIFEQSFPPAVVTPLPGKLKASGPATLNGKKLCIAGDEASVEVKDCVYTTPQFSIPGKGTLKIQQIGPDQKAQKTKSGSTQVLLQGSKFIAKFEVTQPAKQPPPGPGSPIPDPLSQYVGQGKFETTNTIFKGQ